MYVYMYLSHCQLYMMAEIGRMHHTEVTTSGACEIHIMHILSNDCVYIATQMT